MKYLYSLKNKAFLFIFVICLAFPVIAQDDKPILGKGRELTQSFYEGKLKSIFDKFSPMMKQAINLKAFEGFRQNVINSMGAEKLVKSEKIFRFLKDYTYERIIKFEKLDKLYAFLWSFNDQGIIKSVSIEEQVNEPESQFSNYVTKTNLQLPFNGKWFVFWGGRNVRQNYHVKYPSQRFAYDFVIAKNNSSFKGSGKKNEDYYCFGSEIVAPASGEIIKILDGIEDNEPGIMNPKQPYGNLIILDHKNGEFSVFCHLMKNSLKVKKGQQVKKGQLLALCGNSGNSSEAHLHYHLQNKPDLRTGLSIPAKFQAYYENDKHINLGEPIRSQIIWNK